MSSSKKTNDFFASCRQKDRDMLYNRVMETLRVGNVDPNDVVFVLRLCIHKIKENGDKNDRKNT